jgi:hypothetical protein
MKKHNSGLMTFAQRVNDKAALRHERTIEELEEENSRLRAKYSKALFLLRQYKFQAERSTLPDPTRENDLSPTSVTEKEQKVTNVWRERLLRMNSISPRKEREIESRPVEVLELAEALNSGEIRLESKREENVDEISELLSNHF